MGIVGIVAKIGLFMLLIVAIIISPLACSKESEDISRYDADVKQYKAENFMPALDGLGESADVDYYIRMDEGFFPNYSLRLIVTYEEAEFLAQKERLETAYAYLDAPQRDFLDRDFTMPVTEFSTAGFDFRIVKLEDTDYPKFFGMVGISDEKCQIAYLWQYDPDLDYICEADEDPNAKMIEFVKENFKLG